MEHLTKEEATKFFSILYGGEHHIPGDLKEWGRGWSVIHRGGAMATYDYSDLTRLVILAHETCIRAEVRNGGPGAIKICIWRRERESDNMSQRHPALEDNIKLIKQYRWPENLVQELSTSQP